MSMARLGSIAWGAVAVIAMVMGYNPEMINAAIICMTIWAAADWLATGKH